MGFLIHPTSAVRYSYFSTSILPSSLSEPEYHLEPLCLWSCSSPALLSHSSLASILPSTVQVHCALESLPCSPPWRTRSPWKRQLHSATQCSVDWSLQLSPPLGSMSIFEPRCHTPGSGYPQPVTIIAVITRTSLFIWSRTPWKGNLYSGAPCGTRHH